MGRHRPDGTCRSGLSCPPDWNGAGSAFPWVWAIHLRRESVELPCTREPTPPHPTSATHPSGMEPPVLPTREPRRLATTGSLRWIAAERGRAARLVSTPRGPSLRLTVELNPDQLAQLALRVSDLLAARDVGPATASPYFTVAEAADYLRCSRERIHALLTRRRLTRHKDGGRTLVLHSELEAYVRPVTQLRKAA